MGQTGFRLEGITVDCLDVPRVAGFWGRLLDTDPVPDEDLPGWLRLEPAAPGTPRLSFQPVGEAKQGKVRIHLDLVVDDIDAALATVAEFGGAATGERHDYDAGVVVVMTDPEGHEFCLMRLFDAQPAVPTARLRPMTEPEYAAWRARSVESYALDVAASTGRPVDEVRAEADAEYARLVPNGLATEGMRLMSVLDADDEAVGILWLGPHPRRPGAAYVWDIEIDEAHRGRGLGRATMLAAEQLARDAGYAVIGLNVFGTNDRAQRLYTSLRYRIETMQMAKDL